MKTKNIVIACAALLTFASCAEKDSWSPGPKVDPNSPKVYFGASDGRVEQGGEYLEIPVSRVNTTAAITVPISVVSAALFLFFL
jgi:hypothetical protein